MSTDGIKAKLRGVESDISRNNGKIAEYVKEEGVLRRKIDDLTRELRTLESKRQDLEKEGNRLVERKHQIEAELSRAEVSK